MFLHHAISWFVALIWESLIIWLGSFPLVAGWGWAGSGPAQRKKQKFVSTALLTTHTRAFIHRKIGFLFNINRSTNGSLCFFAVLKQGSYLRFCQTWRFIVDSERGPLFLEVKRPPCLAFRASHVTWCLMMSFWSQKFLWDCVGGKEHLLMRNRVQVCWHRGGSCLHANLKPNQIDGVKPSRPTNVILQSNIQQIPDKHEQLWESPRNYQLGR